MSANQSSEPLGYALQRLVRTMTGCPTAPASTRSCIFLNSGNQRSTWATKSTTPASSQTRTASSAWPVVRASGFSALMFFPAAAAALMYSRWVCVGVHISTTSTSTPASIAFMLSKGLDIVLARERLSGLLVRVTDRHQLGVRYLHVGAGVDTRPWFRRR